MWTAAITFCFCLIACRPAQLYFFGDTWDILVRLNEQGVKAIWMTHNDHFVPVPNLLLYAEFLLFGMNNLPYQLVNILIHTLTAAALCLLCGRLGAASVVQLFGALFFSLSGVYWEVTLWETTQQISLSLLFTLASLLFFLRYLERPEFRPLIGSGVCALLACVSMGFGFVVVPALICAAAGFGWMTWRRSLTAAAGVAASAVFAYFLLFAALGEGRGVVSTLARQDTSRSADQIVTWVAKSLWLGSVLPLSNSYVGPISLLVVIFVVAVLRNRSFPFLTLPAFLVPLSLILGSHVLAGLGRAGELHPGPSSRYQYYSVAGLALLAAWLLGLALDLLRVRLCRIDSIAFPFIIVSLVAHGLRNTDYIHELSPRFQWGRTARQFVEEAIVRVPATPPPGMFYAAPELRLPAAAHPHRPDLRRYLPLFASGGFFVEENPVSVRAVIAAPDVWNQNLLRLRHADKSTDLWKCYGGATASATQPASVNTMSIRIVLPPTGGAFGLDADICNSRKPPYTFAARVRKVSGEPNATLRIVFKRSDGAIIETPASDPIASEDFQWMVLSAVAPPSATVVAVDVASTRAAPGPSIVEITDPIVLRHPVQAPVSAVLGQGAPSPPKPAAAAPPPPRQPKVMPPAKADSLPFLAVVDSPKSGDTIEGVTRLAGWVLSSTPVRTIEILVNGVKTAEAKLDDHRPDVAAAHPGYPGHPQNGFSKEVNFARFGTGARSVLVRAILADGSVKRIGEAYVIVK